MQQQINDQTTYFLPAPSNICSKAEDNKHHFIAFGLTPEPYQTDIGKIQLPTLPDKVNGLVDSRGFKPLENTWMSTKVWQAVLNGDISQVNKLSSQIYQLEDFMTGEYRLGIELQSPYRSIKEGQLYQTTHLRLNANTSIFMPVQYDDEHLQQLNADIVNKKSLVRLGGEARMASVQFDSDAIEYLPKVPEKFTDNKPNGKKHFMLYFISKLSMETGWLPAGFKQNATQNGFVGNINGIEMTILSACIGKAYREGGWNQLEHKPRAIENYLPVGSAFFVEVEAQADDKAIAQALHGQTYLNNAWGEGIMLVGKMIQN